MARFSKDPNALRGTHHPGMYDSVVTSSGM